MTITDHYAQLQTSARAIYALNSSNQQALDFILGTGKPVRLTNEVYQYIYANSVMEIAEHAQPPKRFKQKGV